MSKEGESEVRRNEGGEGKKGREGGREEEREGGSVQLTSQVPWR